MDQVADNLFVGTTDDATNGSALESQNGMTIISLTHDTPNPIPHHLSVHSIPLIDGPQANREQFTEAVEATVAAKKADKTVLVHCSAGASRSPTVAATALALTENMELQEALEKVATDREAVDPHEAILRCAAQVYTKLK